MDLSHRDLQNFVLQAGWLLALLEKLVVRHHYQHQKNLHLHHRNHQDYQLLDNIHPLHHHLWR